MGDLAHAQGQSWADGDPGGRRPSPAGLAEPHTPADTEVPSEGSVRGRGQAQARGPRVFLGILMERRRPGAGGCSSGCPPALGREHGDSKVNFGEKNVHFPIRPKDSVHRVPSCQPEPKAEEENHRLG